MPQAAESDLTLGVVGAGAMGRGIVQIAAAAGVPVRLTDAREGAAAEAVAFVARMLDRQVEKGRLSAAQREVADACVQTVDDVEGLASCDVVVEAIVEDLAVKRELFQRLERVVADDCILATNTSSLSVTAIAAGCERPQRVAGYHFFNPVPLMKIVEVIRGLRTADRVADRLAALAERMGHFPARTVDTPGFLVNHAGRGFLTEALRVLSEGIAAHPDIDRVLREAAGFRMGPFELLDLTGMDVSHPVMESVYRQFYDEPRFRPLPSTAQRYAGGLFGRKTGEGYYRYEEGRKVDVPETPVPAGGGRPFWIDRRDAEAAARLAEILTAAGLTVEDAAAPSEQAVCVVLPYGHDATSTATGLGLDARRTVAVDPLFGFAGRRTLMTTPVTEAAARDAAHAALAADGTPVTVIHDSPGFIAQRVIAAIVNIGCDIAQQRIAEPQTIDRAVQLGLGYPSGPLGFGDRLGAARVLAILEGLQSFYGDPRYRPSPWLKRRAVLGVPLTTPEG